MAQRQEVIYAWKTPSDRGSGTYDVVLYQDGSTSCSCRAWRYPKAGQPRGCKHLRRLAPEIMRVEEEWRLEQAWPVTARQRRAVEGAGRRQVVGIWVVPSRSQPGTAHEIRLYDTGEVCCSCPGWTYREQCFHVSVRQVALENCLRREEVKNRRRRGESTWGAGGFPIPPLRPLVKDTPEELSEAAIRLWNVPEPRTGEMDLVALYRDGRLTCTCGREEANGWSSGRRPWCGAVSVVRREVVQALIDNEIPGAVGENLDMPAREALSLLGGTDPMRAARLMGITAPAEPDTTPRWRPPRLSRTQRVAPPEAEVGPPAPEPPAKPPARPEPPKKRMILWEEEDDV